MDDPGLIPAETWQTPQRGTNEQEYQIYVTNARALNQPVKSYEDWLNS